MKLQNLSIKDDNIDYIILELTIRSGWLWSKNY